jgi:uncharacterized damage-inducible protein DinB
VASERAAALADELASASVRLVRVIEPIDENRWRAVQSPGVWSISKDAEHVAEATVFHQWIVRLTIGEKVSSRRPRIERKLLTSDLSPAEMGALVRERSEEGERLLRALTDEQLDRPTKPPRAGGQLLATTIQVVLINHFDGHRAEIEGKLRALQAS